MLTPKQLAACVLWACETEVNAPKPGNVNRMRDGHGMQRDDFLRSARAIAPVLARPELTLGTRILEAIRATRQVVDCNTNLGIVLLLAPLCQAALQVTHFAELRPALRKLLEASDREDAIACYAAIRLAEAGGLGQVETADLADTPEITLWQAMALAEQRDRIAYEYTHAFETVFACTFPCLTNAIESGASIEYASVFAYLCTLSRHRDSLIERKYSPALAESISAQARQLLQRYPLPLDAACDDALLEWDTELKQRQVNPGTTADLTAAALMLFALQTEMTTQNFSSMLRLSGRH